jgi:hypothetical protein
VRSNLIFRFHLTRHLKIEFLLGQLAPRGLHGGRCLTDTSTGWLAAMLAGTGKPNLLRVCNDSAYRHACLRTGMLAGMHAASTHTS